MVGYGVLVVGWSMVVLVWLYARGLTISSFFWGFGDFWVGYVGKKAWDCEFLYRYLIFRFGNNFISYPRKDLCVAL